MCSRHLGPGCRRGFNCQPVPSDLWDYLRSIGNAFDKRAIQISNVPSHLDVGHDTLLNTKKIPARSGGNSSLKMRRPLRSVVLATSPVPTTIVRQLLRQLGRCSGNCSSTAVPDAVLPPPSDRHGWRKCKRIVRNNPCHGVVRCSRPLFPTRSTSSFPGVVPSCVLAGRPARL